MTCSQTKTNLSAYLDGAMSGTRMSALSAHLEGCSACRREYDLLRESQQMLAGLRHKRPPADLSLKLRIAISREVMRSRQPWWHPVTAQLDHIAQSFMVPATAGLMGSIVFFGLLIGMFSVPQPLRAAGGPDVPIIIYQPAQLASTPFHPGVQTSSAGAVVVETWVDANGRVQDYRILSAPEGSRDEELKSELNQALIFTVFRPATIFGLPTSSRVVVSFSRINVQG